MARSTAEIELVALVAEATKTIKDFSKDTQGQLDKINMKSSVTSISTGFLAIKEVVGPVFSAISGFVNKSVDEAIEAERANTQLAQSLKLVGDFSEEAISSFNDFADELARTTTLQDDQVISAAALAKSYKLTNQEAKLVVKSAAELSAATGQDLNTAVETLSKTFNGFVSKELKQLAPELKTLTAAQLEAGDAVKILGERFEGTAAALRGTAGGSVTALGNAFSDLAETIGTSIIKSDAFTASIGLLTSAVQGTTEVIKGNEEALNKLSFDAFVDPSVLAEANEQMKNLKDNTQEFADSLKAAQRIAQGKIAIGRSDSEIEASIKAQRKLNNEREKAEKDFQSIRSGLELAGLGEIEKINKEALGKIAKLRAAGKFGVDTGGINIEKSIAAIKIDAETKILELNKKQSEELKKTSEARRKDIENFSREPIKQLVEFAAKGIDKQQAIGIGAGLLANIAKGAAGAKSLLQSGIGAIGDALLPGIGGAVSEIAGILAEGPEATRKTVEEFANALPKFVENLIDSLPVLIQALAEKLPPALAKTFPFLAERFAIEMVKNMPIIIRGFAQGLIDAAKQFGQAVLDAVKSFGGIFGGGDDGGLFGNGGFLGTGLAEGGRVPNRPEFSGDRFPARLDAGEQVFSRDLTSQLEDFLNNSGGQSAAASQQPLQINLNIGLQQFAKIMLEADRLGYRVRTT